MNTIELARRGAALARSGRWSKTVAAQLPPVGPPPAAELLLVGALMWGADEAEAVLALVRDDDLADPALAEVLAVIRSMVAAGRLVGPVLVAADLRRGGEPSKAVADRLLQATAAGAVGAAVRGYACAVLAESLRRRAESAGAALSAAATTVAEDDLAPLAERAAAAVVDCAERLARLRGER